jgi:uncharacterized protein (TIGR03435 family)
MITGLLASLLLAQTPPATPTFEVVSIKATNETMMSLIQAGRDKDIARIEDGAAYWGAINLMNLLQRAYDLPALRILGPEWLSQDRFQISAKFPAGANRTQVPQMLQAMLQDRFRMKAHLEQRETPVYLLVQGKGALKMTPTTAQTEVPPDQRGCTADAGTRICHGVSLESLAGMLSPQTQMQIMGMPDRPVVDRTGLTGPYDFTFQMGRIGGRRANPTLDADGRPDNSNLITTSDAVKTLGLALEAGKAPLTYLVIEHIERKPSEN